MVAAESTAAEPALFVFRDTIVPHVLCEIAKIDEQVTELVFSDISDPVDLISSLAPGVVLFNPIFPPVSYSWELDRDVSVWNLWR